MARESSGRPQARRGKANLLALTLGPAWLPLGNAIKELFDECEPGAAAVMLTDAVTSGKLTVFTDFLWRYQSDSWEDGTVSRAKAQALGVITSDIAGPTNRSLALSPVFWERASNLSSALGAARDKNNLELIELSSDGGSKSKSPFAWEVHRPIVSALQVELLKALIGLRQYNPPKPARGVGRPRTDKWDGWTAELVLYVHENGISDEIQADELAVILEGKIHSTFKEAPDRTSAKMTLDKVLARWRTFMRDPQKS